MTGGQDPHGERDACPIFAPLGLANLTVLQCGFII
jgi:hypothetical protein